MGVSEKQAWTEEEDDFLRRSAEQGMSATAVTALMAEIFGRDRSRSALLGRAHRQGIAFRSVEAARGENAATARPPKPPRARKPKAETRLHPGNIATKAARLKEERDTGRFERVAAEQAAIEATLAAQAEEPNEGVLFIDREMGKQCAWPMLGWEQASIWEKRVCGRPVVVRRIVCDGVASFVPSSWCLSCQPKALAPDHSRRRDIFTLAGVSRRAA